MVFAAGVEVFTARYFEKIWIIDADIISSGFLSVIENVEVGGVYKDFLKIVYDGGDIIYVDINNMNYIDYLIYYYQKRIYHLI